MLALPTSRILVVPWIWSLGVSIFLLKFSHLSMNLFVRDVLPLGGCGLLPQISQMLMFDPSKRITVEQALEHPYLASLHDISDEPCAQEPFEFEYEYEKLKESDIRELVYKEALEIHPL